MFLYFVSLIFVSAEGGWFESFLHWWHAKADPILNYPGFEVWKFLNLAIFVYILYRLLRVPLGGAFKAKREAIRADLIKAEEEKKNALAKLTDVEAKFAHIENEKINVLKEAQKELDQEKERILQETKSETMRLREQGEAEIARVIQQSKIDLRHYSAEETIRRAEALIKGSMNESADSRLVKTAIQSMGGVKS